MIDLDSIRRVLDAHEQGGCQEYDNCSLAQAAAVALVAEVERLNNLLRCPFCKAPEQQGGLKCIVCKEWLE